MSDIPNELRNTADLFRRNDLAGARTAGEAALRKYPSHPVLLELMGVVYARLGDTGKSVEALRRAVSMKPSSIQARMNLAKALMDHGTPADAVGVTDPQAVPGGMSPDLWRLRGDALRQAGRTAEAIAAFEAALRMKPDIAVVWNNLGNARRASGDLEGAIDALTRALNLDRASVNAHLNLARALDAAGQTQAAIGILNSGLKLAPDNVAMLVEIGNAYSRLNRPDDALPYLQQAVASRPDDFEVQLALGYCHTRARNFEPAEKAYKSAIALRPGEAIVYLNYGGLLESANRVSEVQALVEKAVAAGVPDDDLAILRANWLRREGRVAEALQLAQGAKALTVGMQIERAQLIATTADELNDIDTAFAAIMEMNGITAAEPLARDFSGKDYRSNLAHQVRVTTEAWMNTLKPVEVDTSRPSPAFLMGFPRSGTTLLDTFLMGHPGIHVLEEEPLINDMRQVIGDVANVAELDSHGLNKLRAAYFGGLDALKPPRGKLVVDKMPMHVVHLPMILRVFPDARLIFAERHPCDAVLSCFMQNFGLNPAMASFLELRSSAELYDLFMTYWFQCGDLFRPRVHAVRYERVVEDAELQMRPLVSFLGLPWSDAIMDHQQTAAARRFIPTPSYSQVTEKIYTRAKGRWERYRKYLEPVLPTLSPWCERFGYAVD